MTHNTPAMTPCLNDEGRPSYRLTQTVWDMNKDRDCPPNARQSGTAQTMRIATQVNRDADGVPYPYGHYLHGLTVQKEPARDTIIHKPLFDVEGYSVPMTRREIFRTFGNRQAKKMFKKMRRDLKGVA